MHAVRIILSSAILAFCGLVYEFVFAQTLSILLGNSIVQYSLTIGVFMAAMGCGSLFWGEREDAGAILLSLQIALCILAPLFFLALWILPPGYSVSYLFVAGVGLITGAELPLLMRLAGERDRLKVVAADYVGMLAACLMFPLLLLPEFGLFKTLFLAALLNAGVALSFWSRGKTGLRAAMVTWPLVLIVLLLKENVLREFLSQIFISNRR